MSELISYIRNTTAPLNNAGANTSFIQPKLSVNQPGDVYEQEADRVAEQVVQTKIREPFIPLRPVPVTPVQRQCAHCEQEEKKMQRKEQDKEVPDVDNQFENYAGNLSGAGTPLPNNVRNYYEPRFGYDFSNVRVHTGTVAAKSAQSVNALAYTTGNNIVFNNGQYAPETNSGKKLLAHELTHVVQQQGQAGNIQRKDGCMLNDSPEAVWAGQNDGKVFKTGDDDAKPNEAILWNFCAAETAMRENHKLSLQQETPRWKGMLVGNGTTAATRPDMKIRLQGAASSSGNADANTQLALKRAEAVRDFLVSEGIPGSFIEISGAGSQFPLADETSPENMARNRRVELTLFTPTQTADIPGNVVAANVKTISIGKSPKQMDAPFFDPATNRFARSIPALKASAEVDLVGFKGDSIGFYQLLIGDTRIGLYRSPADNSELLLDYGRCNPVLPCRDIEDATSRYSYDNRSLFLQNTGSASGTLGIVDRPGTVFPLKYPDPANGPYELVHYFWKMDFDVILGIRSASLFMPLQSAIWNLAAAEDVDITAKTVSGMAPIAVHQDFVSVSAKDKKASLDMAFSGPTCRLMSRSREVAPDELPCRPAVS
ncbi:MAG: DUF4157 domain-containing protein [Chitinophagaceae bacterium]